MTRIRPRRPRLWNIQRRDNELSPDGVRVRVDWDDFVPGTSIFVPAVNLVELVSQMNVIAKEKDYMLDHHVRIEGGKLGVRFWRIE